MSRLTTIRCSPIAALPIAVRPPSPGLIAAWDFRGDVVERRSGWPMACNLPALYGKYYDRFGMPCIAGADIPRLNGLGAILEGEGKDWCTNAAWTAVGSITPTVGAYSLGILSLDLITGQTASCHRYQFHSMETTVASHAVSCHVKQGNLATGYLTIRDHDLSLDSSIRFSFVTGGFVAGQDTLNPSVGTISKWLMEPLKDDVWRVGFVYTPATANVHSCCVKTGTANPDDYMYAGEGSVVLEDNFSSYIPTNGEALTRATDAASAGADGNGYKFLLANNPQLAAALASKGAFHSLFQPRFAFADGLTDLGLWTVNDTVEGPLYIGSDSKLTMSDGTNVVALDYAYSLEEQLDVRPWWDGNSMGLKLYDALGNLLDENGGSFVGAWPNVGYLKPHFGNEASCIQRSLSAYDNVEAA